MSAIVSLLRVMTLRDAEAISLEPGKVPTLRRRGQVEALAMPALDAEHIEAFAAPLIADKSLDAGPLMVAFVDEDHATYPVTIERGKTGLRVVARRAKPAPAPAPPAHGFAATAAISRAAADAAAASAQIAESPHHAPLHGDGAPARGDGRAATERDMHGARHAERGARARAARLLAQPVAMARERGASDVFVSTGQQARVRVDGRLEPLDVPIDDGELAALAADLAGDAAGVNADLGLELAGTRIRVNVFDHTNGVAIAARLIRDHVPGLAELQLPAELGSIVELRDGLVLVCGPTGSGKSTTLAALIDLLDQRRAAHVVTLEDPIEYRFAARRCLIHQRELGNHVPTFAAGLRAALREAPDVILLGELRDTETLQAALTAAETGHLVLATLHAPSAIGAIDRVIDAFPDGQQRQVRTQLAGALRCIVTQYLLPKRDGGRAPAIEYVPVTAAVSNIIRKGDLHTLPTAIQSGREAGMIPLERSLARLLESGAVAPQVVKRIAADHDLLSALSPKR
jgi:twitching motility protein PilT